MRSFRIDIFISIKSTAFFFCGLTACVLKLRAHDLQAKTQGHVDFLCLYLIVLIVSKFKCLLINLSEFGDYISFYTVSS